MIVASMCAIGAAPSPLIGYPVSFQEKSLKQWVAMLQSRNGRERDQAIQALRVFGPRGADAIPQLIKLLGNCNEPTTVRILNTLASMKWAAKPAVPSIGTVLNRSSGTTQLFALYLLERFGEDARLAIPDVYASLQPEKLASLAYRRRVPLALGKIAGSDRAVRMWLVMRLTDRDIGVRLNAARGLWQNGVRNICAYLILAIALNHSDSQVREAAIAFVAVMCRTDMYTGRKLLRLLNDPDTSVRRTAIRTLIKLGFTRPSAFPNYLRLLEDKDWSMRCYAMTIIGKYGLKGVKAIPSLNRCVRARSPFVRVRALFTLWQINPAGNKMIVHALHRYLQLPNRNEITESHYAALLAAELLGEMGSAAEAAIPALAKAAKSNWEELQKTAVDSLAKIRGNGSVGTKENAGKPCRKASVHPGY